MATTKVTWLLGRTPALRLCDWEITLAAGYRLVALYLILPRSPRSARAALAVVSFIPTSVGTLTMAMVVGGAVAVVGRVVIVATVGNGELIVGGAVGWLAVVGAVPKPAAAAGSGTPILRAIPHSPIPTSAPGMRVAGLVVDAATAKLLSGGT